MITADDAADYGLSTDDHLWLIEQDYASVAEFMVDEGLSYSDEADEWFEPGPWGRPVEPAAAVRAARIFQEGLDASSLGN